MFKRVRVSALVAMHKEESLEKLWKENFDGKYRVSDFGDIVNVETGYTLRHKPCNQSGYHLVGTYLSEYGSNSVHRIVYEVFVGKIPEGLQINHIDGNKSNNHLSNLEVCTASENIKHAFRLGLNTPNRGEKAHNSKVTEDEVISMYGMFKNGYSNDQVAEVFKLHSRYVSLIRHGKRWKHLFERESMERYDSLGLTMPLPKAIYIYNMCLCSKMKQEDLGELLGIDPTQVSRIRTGNAWRKLRKHFGIRLESYDWRDAKDSLKISEI